MTSYWCEVAWLDDAPVESVRITLGVRRPDRGGRARRPRRGSDDTRLAGLVLPGFANAHSHAFHRALRGRTHADGGTFWTWREGMYAVAARLDPDSYVALARATYAEMALAGITCVGEFHYLHHGPDGTPYDDPNAMGHALQQAAWEAGVRLTLLDAAYLKGGLTPEGHTPARPRAAPVQRLERRHLGHPCLPARADRGRPGGRGRALGPGGGEDRHRPDRGDRGRAGAPMHVHVSEQPAENDACRGYYLCSPTELLEDEGAMGEHVTAVHATHLSERDVKLLGTSRTNVCFTPDDRARPGRRHRAGGRLHARVRS